MISWLSCSMASSSPARSAFASRREIYELGAEQIRLPPPQCVFVDDLPFNLKPAAELGMATVHHTDPGVRSTTRGDAGYLAAMRRGGGLAVLVSAAALAGCGSASSRLRISASSPPRSADRHAAGGANHGTGAPAQSGAFLAAGVAALTPESRELRALDPPRAEQTSFRTATGALAESLDLLRRARIAIRQGNDPAGVIGGCRATWLRSGPRQRAWQALGIPACELR